MLKPLLVKLIIKKYNKMTKNQNNNKIKLLKK